MLKLLSAPPSGLLLFSSTRKYAQTTRPLLIVVGSSLEGPSNRGPLSQPGLIWRVFCIPPIHR